MRDEIERKPLSQSLADLAPIVAQYRETLIAIDKLQGRVEATNALTTLAAFLRRSMLMALERSANVDPYDQQQLYRALGVEKA